MLGHRALGERLRTVFIENGLMRQGEPEQVVGFFRKLDFGRQIEICCWESVDARTAVPTQLPFETIEKLAAEIIRDVPGIVSVTYNIAPKPPSIIEAI